MALFFSLLFLSLPALHFLGPATVNITLFGDARLRNDSVSLTKERNCSIPQSSSFSVGRALYSAPVRFLDLNSNAVASFSSSFSFTLTPSSPSCGFGDGLAFLITSNADSFIHFDGYLGLPYNAQDAYFAVEFDTNFDAALGDINGNHVGIDVNNVISFASVDGTASGADLKGMKELTAWIEYSHPMRTVQVWVGASFTKPSIPLLVAHIDLSKQFKEFMRVGFSASNGRGSAAHVVRRWRFKTTLSSSITKDTFSLDSADCFLCSPDDSGTKTAAGIFQDLHYWFHSGLKTLGFKGLIALTVSAFSVMAISCYFLFKSKLRSRVGLQDCAFRADNVPERLTLSEIKSATMSFCRKRVIGQGASATVYKGLLPSGELVAVKRFNHINCFDSFNNSFSHEFATMAEFLKHKNLVQLLGWCCEGGELVLVYEYMPSGSLDKLLHNNVGAVSVLSWEKRLRIILGVASALTYLHEECERQIIHRDVKACNIMLDADFNAKLGDFGLAEVYEHSTVNRQATLPAGTMGYLAPEYVYSGVPTEKTDVYSFGVVILEVATGRRPVDDDGTVVVDTVWEKWEKGKLMEAADVKLRGRFKTSEMERILIVGLLCVHPNFQSRPTIKDAAKIIKGEAAVPFLPKKKPTLRMGTSLLDDPADISSLDGGSSQGLDEGYMTPETHLS
uniref:non-specific serine/threonine protein kinase n=1 Tax=Kalanchoe fedtschenkoi TaxID=63787 RepID=A0A7N0ZW64_KALFE